MEPLHTRPEASSFVLLADHQSRTPASFYSGPPVLHYHSKACKLVTSETDIASVPALNAIRGDGAATGTNGNENGVEGEEGREVVVDMVDVWVTSDKFLIYAPAVAKGLSITYPSISLHAIQRLCLPANPSDEVQGLYMQIATPTLPSADDEEENSITLTIVPSTSSAQGGDTSTSESAILSAAEGATADQTQEQQEGGTESATQMFYTAVSACSNLHPDPVLPGEEDDDDDDYDIEGAEVGGDGAFIQTGTGGAGGLPPAFPGSSGWITAENMHEYFDEEGNWIAGGEEPTLPLGPGAGTVRQREEGREDGEGGHEQGGEESDETKWQRTD